MVESGVIIVALANSVQLHLRGYTNYFSVTQSEVIIVAPVNCCVTGTLNSGTCEQCTVTPAWVHYFIVTESQVIIVAPLNYCVT